METIVSKPGSTRAILVAILAGLVGFVQQAVAQTQAPIVYTIRVASPETQFAEVEASAPTGNRASVEMMMPIWSPGYYRVEDYAGRVQDFAARKPDGTPLDVEKTRKNRWQIRTGGAPAIVVSYRILCAQRSVTTNWISSDLGVFNGAATFITLVETTRRPHEVHLELPPTWKRAMTGLDAASDAAPNHYRAADYETLVDSPIVAGDLDVHEFEVAGIKHYLVDAGERGSWDGQRAALDLGKIVRESLPYWGSLPYKKYVFLNLFRPGGGGLEHKNSALLTANAARVSTPAGYHGWLEFVGHEYFHAFNVKRLRPVELGPFDYESEPHTSSLWISEGFTSYFGDLLVARAGFSSPQEFLSSMSAPIEQLQKSPGRLVQTLEQSSNEVWTNSNSGVNPNSATVSYYTKGQVLGFLLDAKIRRATRDSKSLDDAMRLAYQRYGGERGFTPDEFRATVEETASADLKDWFRKAISSTEELDYEEALDWFGLRFTTTEGPPAQNWKLELRDNATEAQQNHFRRWLAPSGVSGTAQPPRADILRGEYGRYRANNDLLFYHLDVRIDPERKFISGKTTIRFRMLKDDTRIQLDLTPSLRVDKILLGAAPLKYERELSAVFVDFPETLKSGRVVTIDFYYSGVPQETGRFGGITFRKDASGHPWINTACEEPGASVWWPNKDQWRDEVERMEISVAIPNDLVDVSNGKFVGKTDLGDGYTRWDWLVQYPINNYDVSLNIGNYTHFTDRLGDMTLDFYALPENLDKAKKQFVQAKSMLEAFQKYFGEYPFKKDGYKLIEVPYSGMEHQSAVTYGNRFANGYLERDWTGVGVSLKFDFIIIHESAHEWFGNSVTAADVSDEWIHEGWATYLESLYVEHVFGYDDALKYVNGYKSRVQNRAPIIAQRGIHQTPPQDMYFKGALFLHTLRNVVNDDSRWWKLLHDLYQRFKYQTIMSEDIVQFFNQKTGMNLTPIFDQYLRHTAIPTLELRFDDSGGSVAYRWNADVDGFAMPVRVGKKGQWQIIQPALEWKMMPTSLKREEFQIATDLYYVNVSKR